MKPNSIQDIADYVESRLQEWGEWFRGGLTIGLGYPHESSIMKFQQGISFNQKDKTFAPPLPTNESAEEIERFIVEMAQQNHIMAEVLKRYYIGQEPHIALKAKALKMSISKFKMLLAMARQWLAGRLSSEK